MCTDDEACGEEEGERHSALSPAKALKCEPSKAASLVLLLICLILLASFKRMCMSSLPTRRCPPHFERLLSPAPSHHKRAQMILRCHLQQALPVGKQRETEISLQVARNQPFPTSESCSQRPRQSIAPVCSTPATQSPHVLRAIYTRRMSRSSSASEVLKVSVALGRLSATPQDSPSSWSKIASA